MRSSLSNGILSSVVSLLTLFPSLLHAEPARYALVVGVKEYPASEKLPTLSYTETDADKISETLKASGYAVTLMTQSMASSGEGNRRFAPTAGFIRKQFGDLVETPFLKKEDCVLVFLEGHGIQLPSKTNAKNTTFYFCASDSFIDELTFSEDVTDRHNLIPVQEIYDTLNKSPAGVKLLVADACRNDPNKRDSFRSSNSETRPEVPVPPGGMAAFFSCSAGQRAVEDANLKHGVFSYYLIEGLTGKADFDNNREITVSELQTYVGRRVYDYVRQKYSRKQLPELTGKIQGFAALLSIPEKFVRGKKSGDLWSNNSLVMKFRWCSPGTFRMGSPESEPNRNKNENQVRVTLTEGFWLGQYEVTQGEWEKLMGTTLSQQDEKDGNTTGVFQGIKGAGVTHPMYHVNWDEASEFCRKLTEQERKAGRLPADWEFTLPTEAQWEYACRAGTTTATVFGNRLSSTQANFQGESPYNGGEEGPEKDETVVVGSYKPNAWYLYDMHGNVHEWCRDYYTKQLSGGIDPETTVRSTDRVNRGGGWSDQGVYCRSAFRNNLRSGYRDNGIGFRVALVQNR